ncbi:hypothetical protein FLT15_16490 [Paenibacillus thiaminolyticus]|uniref:hypothetical protein n=1 Tax=Paenibacillus thiaminolyticus TaxID=49283 RepID=UPI0011648A37|nr:hypothetical protein [Paenibacillus thiaminolyticus]NGP56805.1 hypothetical protein [Paenibacillus thiaminolyticus]NGP58797.1 hypothetical protein [Paenibacillus thiaminolyticus]NGP59904.1 hypothetical protein [Paenibacillus thiaminolyticus]
MPYVCMNPDIKRNIRADQRAKRRSAEKVASGERWEFVRGMYGNVYEVVDHERFRWYRQDRPIDGQGDLFEGFLPLMCDYCGRIVANVKHVQYRCVYWFYARPHLPNAEWKQCYVDVKFCCCDACHHGPLPIPAGLIGYHMTELYQDEKLIYTQERKK